MKSKACALAWKNELGVSPGDLTPKTKEVVGWLSSQGGSPMQSGLQGPLDAMWPKQENPGCGERIVISSCGPWKGCLGPGGFLFPAPVSLGCGLSPQTSVYVFSQPVFT